MAETPDQKQQLTAAISTSRVQVQNEVLLLKRKLDMRKNILESIKSHPWEWASSAAIVGWLLSRLPARRKKIYVDGGGRQADRRGKGPAAKVFREVWQIFKPMIAAYLAKLWVENAK